MRRFTPALLIPFMTLLASPALAHTGHGTDGFTAGLSHPFNGLDHMLAMVGVGLWAAQLGGRNLWLVPSAFVGTMVLGAALALYGIALPQVELGIAGSVLVIGLLIGLGTRAPTGLAAAIVALLALFHGYAHGSELPAAASAAGYAIGFVVATSLLHLAGLALGFAIQTWAKPAFGRALGILTALMGGALVLGL